MSCCNQRKNVKTVKMQKASNGIACRICKSCSGNDLMKSPCYCKGSMGYVHFTCLEQWLNEASRDYCELCRYKFQAIQTRRYSLLQSLLVWTLHPSNRTYLCYDILIALVLTALTAAIVFICLMGAQMFELDNRSGTRDPFVRAVITMFLFILLSSYITTLYLIIQDHVRPWYRWWRTCLDVKLLIDPNKIQLYSEMILDKHTNGDAMPITDIESQELLSLTPSGTTMVIKEINLEKTKSEAKIGRINSNAFIIS